MTDYDYEYDDYEDDEEQFSANWQAEFVKNAQILQNELGRRLTHREIDTVAEMLDEEEYPDVHGAYEQYYEQTEAKEPNLEDSVSRQEYMAERMTEQEQELAEAEQQEADQ